MSHIVILGGRARSLVNFRGHLIREFVARGHRVTAVAPDAPPTIRKRLGELGAAYRHVPIARAGVDPLVDVRTLIALRRLFRSLEPDRLVSYTIKPVIYGTIAARLAGVPRRAAMITGLGYAFTGDDLKQRAVRGVVRKLYRLALAQCDVVFFQNPDDLREFSESGLVGTSTQLVRTNGSGVDLEHFSPAALPERPSVLMLGRLLVDKGVREYVAAARIVRQSRPDITFRLAGSLDHNPKSISRPELESWCDSGDVEYLGALEDVRPALAQSSIFVLPSYREGTPRTVLEAMAMARPIVTTDVPGCRETVIDGQNGYLTPVRDAASLAGAISTLLESPSRMAEFGAASRQLARLRFDVHDVNRTIADALGL